MIANPARTDLRGRREALGLGVADMASGTGISRYHVSEIEAGRTSDSHRRHYAVWLDIIERWPDDVKARQFDLARSGNLFSRVK